MPKLRLLDSCNSRAKKKAEGTVARSGPGGSGQGGKPRGRYEWPNYKLPVSEVTFTDQQNSQINNNRDRTNGPGERGRLCGHRGGVLHGCNGAVAISTRGGR